MLFGPKMVWICGIGSIFFALILALIFVFDRQTFFLSSRNILRNKRRTFITILVISFGFAGMMTLCGFIENGFKTLREGTITSGLGHIQIYKKGYHDKGVVDKAKYNIENYGEIKKILKEDPVISSELKLIAAELDFTGVVGSEDSSAMCMGRGVEKDKDFLLSSFDRLYKGKQLKPEKDEIVSVDEGLIGRGLSRGLGAKTGDYLTVLVVTKSNYFNAIDMKVRGIIQGAAKEYDDTILKLSLKHAQRLMACKDVSKIVVLLKDTKKTDLVAKRLEELIKTKNLDLEYKKWTDLAQFYHKVRQLYRGMFMVFLMIVTIVVIFSIMNTMTMSVMERVKEIGTIRAMGTSKIATVKIFLVEGLMMGVAGAIAAFLLAFVIAFLINNVKDGIMMPPPPGRTFGYHAYFDTFSHPWILFFGFLISMITSFVSSILPAIKASKMDIVDCLRHY